jgi:hypothetical protein
MNMAFASVPTLVVVTLATTVTRLLPPDASTSITATFLAIA